MYKKILAALAVSVMTAAFASATTIAPGDSVSGSTLSYGGTQLLFTGGSPVTGSFSANFSVAVFTDPSNSFCVGCLDFVYQINNLVPGSITMLDAGGLSNALTSVGYTTFAAPGSVAPGTITRSADGNTIDFLFGTGIPVNTYSDYLVVQTNATSFSPNGFTTLADGSTSYTGVGVSAAPEPSTFFLLGTGLIGLAGAAKRKFGI